MSKFAEESGDFFPRDWNCFSDAGLDLSKKSIPIPPFMAGKIIGKGGTTIRTIQQKSGAKVYVFMGQSPSVRITGAEPHVKTAEQLIQDVIEMGSCRCSKVINIKYSHIGTVIGARGSHIKGIQDKSGARIHVNPASEVKETEDVQKVSSDSNVPVELFGTDEQVQRAEELILNIISEMTNKYEEEMGRQTEMTLRGRKLRLDQLSQNITGQELLDLYPDAYVIPRISIRQDENGNGKFATYTFSTPAIASSWMHHLEGQKLGGRRIVCK